MSKSNSKTDRITFITVKNNWLEAGQIKEIKMNKTMDVVQLHFEDGRLAEIHSCNPNGEGNGGLVLSDLVFLDNEIALPTPPLTEPENSQGGVAAELGAASCSAGFLDRGSENNNTPDEQSMNGQIKKAHRLIRSLQERVAVLESQLPLR